MRLSSTSVKRFPSHYRRRLWTSPFNQPILMNGTLGQSNYRTSIFACNQQSWNPEEPHNEETMHRTQTRRGQLDKHLNDSTLNQLEIQTQWTLTTCPPMIEQTWWRKDYASNVESLDTEQKIHNFIRNNKKADTHRCNDHHRIWKEKSSTHTSGHC